MGSVVSFHLDPFGVAAALQTVSKLLGPNLFRSNKVPKARPFFFWLELGIKETWLHLVYMGQGRTSFQTAAKNVSGEELQEN